MSKMIKNIITVTAIATLGMAANAMAVDFPAGECFDTSEEGYSNIMFKTTTSADGTERKTACIDGKSDVRMNTVSVPEDVTVDSIAYNRDFMGSAGTNQQNVYSTAIFPFSINSNPGINNCSDGAVTVYRIVNIKNKWDNSGVYLTAQKNGNIEANVPYFVNATGNLNLYSKTGWGASCGYTLNTSSIMNSTFSASYEEGGASVGYCGDWHFKGTYEKITWNSVADGLGKVYGFAATSKTVNGNAISQGQFVKAAAGAYIPPMRAYLEYDNSSCAVKASLAKTSAVSSIASLTADTASLPSTIEVIFEDENGDVTAIGELNSATGTVSMDKNLWFDMKGRKFNKKPTVKGTYYNQGKKVIIK